MITWSRLKLLGEDRFYYRRDRECEVAGYGIGALGYYRRVVEDVIARLLEELRTLIPESEREPYEAAQVLRRTKERACGSKPSKTFFHRVCESVDQSALKGNGVGSGGPSCVFRCDVASTAAEGRS